MKKGKRKEKIGDERTTDKIKEDFFKERAIRREFYRYAENELKRNKPTLRGLLETRYIEIERLFKTISYRLDYLESKLMEYEKIKRNFNEVNSNINLMIGYLKNESKR